MSAIPFHPDYFNDERYPDGSKIRIVAASDPQYIGLTLPVEKMEHRLIANAWTRLGWKFERVYRFGCRKCGYGWDDDSELCQRCHIGASHRNTTELVLRSVL